jgi:hypothetical protein
MVVGDVKAERSKRDLWTNQKPKSQAAKNGLRYEARVGKELQHHVVAGHFQRIEHNPWFVFEDIYGAASCSPDFLLYTDTGIIIVEVKLTWKEVAIHKLNDLYGPVVAAALGHSTMPLIICRNITKETPPAKFTLSEALASPYRLLQWPDNGRIVW